MSSSFKDLRVWQEAMNLAVSVYRATSKFPKHELYGLSQQLRRAAVSIPSNIAEGKGRRSDREFRNFLMHARGSLFRSADAINDRPGIKIRITRRRETVVRVVRRNRPLLKWSYELDERKPSISRRANDERPTTNDNVREIKPN